MGVAVGIGGAGSEKDVDSALKVGGGFGGEVGFDGVGGIEDDGANGLGVVAEDGLGEAGTVGDGVEV